MREMSGNVAQVLATAGVALAVVAFAATAALGLAAFLIACLRLRGDDPAADAGAGADPGRAELTPDEPGGDGEPPWWDEFERELAAWAAKRRRTPRSPRS
jgi:hypothetical protein